MKKSALSALLLVSSSALVFSQGTVRPVGMAIVFDDVKDQFGGFPVLNQQQPVTLSLVADADGAGIISLDQDKSKVTLLRDDTGKDLKGKLWSFPKISDDGKLVKFELHGEEAPGDQAELIQVKGVLTLVTGSKTEQCKSGVVPVKQGEKVDLGEELVFTINSFGKPQWGEDPFSVELEIKRDIPEVAEVVFYDGNGMVVESSSGGSSRMGFLGNVTVQRSFTLKREVDKLQVEMKVWTDLKEVEIPFDVTMGLGGGK